MIHRALTQGQETYKKGERHAGKLAEIVRATIETEPRVRAGLRERRGCGNAGEAG